MWRHWVTASWRPMVEGGIALAGGPTASSR
jgi:hypothetical protein